MKSLTAYYLYFIFHTISKIRVTTSAFFMMKSSSYFAYQSKHITLIKFATLKKEKNSWQSFRHYKDSIPIEKWFKHSGIRWIVIISVSNAYPYLKCFVSINFFSQGLLNTIFSKKRDIVEVERYEILCIVFTRGKWDTNIQKKAALCVCIHTIAITMFVNTFLLDIAYVRA